MNIEAEQYMKTRHGDSVIEIIDQIIRYCRYLDKEKAKSFADKLGGIDFLNQLLQQGNIKMILYLKIRECVENPTAPYKITIKQSTE